MKFASIAVVGACGWLAACSTASPTTPSSTTVAVSAISVFASSRTLVTGDRLDLIATATRADGTLASVTGGSWSVDNGLIATVDAAGHLSTVGYGRVVASIAFGGATGSVTLSVVPNLAGDWTGSYTVRQCIATFNTHVCGPQGVFGAGYTDVDSLKIVQSGASLTGTSTVRLGYTPTTDTISFAATIDDSGALRVTAVTGWPFTKTHDYSLQVTSKGSLTGTLRQEHTLDWQLDQRFGWIGDVVVVRK